MVLDILLINDICLDINIFSNCSTRWSRSHFSQRTKQGPEGGQVFSNLTSSDGGHRRPTSRIIVHTGCPIHLIRFERYQTKWKVVINVLVFVDSLRNFRHLLISVILLIRFLKKNLNTPLLSLHFRNMSICQL